MSLTSYRAAPPRVNHLRMTPKHRSARAHMCGRTKTMKRVSNEREPAVGRPGDDLLSRALGHSTIGAEGFHGRVRNGIGCFAPRNGHQAVQPQVSRALSWQRARLLIRYVRGVSAGKLATAPDPCGSWRCARDATLREIKPIGLLGPVS